MTFENTLIKLFGAEMKKDPQLCREIWCALANVEWNNDKTESTYSCSWRYAGHLIADIVDDGNDYMDYYMCGPDAVVSERIKAAFAAEGWFPNTFPSTSI